MTSARQLCQSISTLNQVTTLKRQPSRNSRECLIKFQRSHLICISRCRVLYLTVFFSRNLYYRSYIDAGNVPMTPVQFEEMWAALPQPTIKVSINPICERRDTMNLQRNMPRKRKKRKRLLLRSSQRLLLVHEVGGVDNRVSHECNCDLELTDVNQMWNAATD